jgi:hypothetical protein
MLFGLSPWELVWWTFVALIVIGIALEFAAPHLPRRLRRELYGRGIVQSPLQAERHVRQTRREAAEQSAEMDADIAAHWRAATGWIPPKVAAIVALVLFAACVPAGFVIAYLKGGGWEWLLVPVYIFAPVFVLFLVFAFLAGPVTVVLAWFYTVRWHRRRIDPETGTWRE